YQLLIQKQGQTLFVLAVEHFKEFLLRTTFVTFVTSGFAAHIGIIPQSLVSDGQKTKTRLVPPRALHPDRNFATWVHLPRLGSAPLTTNFRRFSAESGATPPTAHARKNS